MSTDTMPRHAGLPARYQVQDAVASRPGWLPYRASDELLDRLVVIAVAESGEGPDTSGLPAGVGLDHPALVPVCNTGVARGCRYLVLQFVDGPCLREPAVRRALTTAAVVGVGARLAGAMATSMRTASSMVGWLPIASDWT